MDEARDLAHGQCTPCVAWPLLQASPVLDGVAQRRCRHTNSALVQYENNNFLLQIASDKHAHLRNMKGTA